MSKWMEKKEVTETIVLIYHKSPWSFGKMVSGVENFL